MLNDEGKMHQKRFHLTAAMKNKPGLDYVKDSSEFCPTERRSWLNADRSDKSLPLNQLLAHRSRFDMPA